VGRGRHRREATDYSEAASRAPTPMFYGQVAPAVSEKTRSAFPSRGPPLPSAPSSPPPYPMVPRCALRIVCHPRRWPAPQPCAVSHCSPGAIQPPAGFGVAEAAGVVLVGSTSTTRKQLPVNPRREGAAHQADHPIVLATEVVPSLQSHLTSLHDAFHELSSCVLPLGRVAPAPQHQVPGGYERVIPVSLLPLGCSSGCTGSWRSAGGHNYEKYEVCERRTDSSRTASAKHRHQCSVKSRPIFILVPVVTAG